MLIKTNKANDSGTHISYRVPESALHMLSVSVAIELQTALENIAVLCLDPGELPTHFNRSMVPDVDITDSVRGIYRRIAGATMANTGQFLNWRGQQLPY